MAQGKPFRPNFESLDCSKILMRGAVNVEVIAQDKINIIILVAVWTINGQSDATS